MRRRQSSAQPRCHLAPRPRGTPCRRRGAPCRARASVAIAFIRAPPSPSRIAALARLVDVDRRVDPAQRAVHARSCRCHGRRIGNLVAEQPEDLLADELGGEEALVAVGELVCRIERRRFRQPRAISPRSAVELRAPFRATPARSRRRRTAARDLGQQRQQRRLVADEVDLVDGARRPAAPPATTRDTARSAP